MIRSRPLRVLHWYWRSHSGGIHRVVTDLAQAQASDRTLEVRRIVGRAGNLPRDASTPEIVGMRHGFDVGRYRAIRSTMEWADVVHMHCYNPVVGAAVRSLSKPCLYTDHGSDQYPSLRNFVVRFQLQRRFVRRRVSLVTVNSQHRQATQSEFYALAPDRVRVIHNGLNFDAIRARRPAASVRRELGLGEHEPVIGTVAMFQLCKRLHLLLETLVALPGVRLVIVGDGEGRRELELRARELGVADRTMFTGYRADAHDLMAAMDIFVLPTEGEGFGLAAAEALALERPVIVWHDGGGLAEVVRDGETGYVVADSHEAATRVRGLFAEPDLRRRLGAAGRADVAARFTIDAMADAMRACYDASVRRTP